MNFAALYGPAPKLENYRDDLRLRQKVRQRYDQLAQDFRGVKALFDEDGTLVEGPDLGDLTPTQVIAFAQASRTAAKLTTRVALCVFNFSHFPIRAVCLDLRSIGKDEMREPRPWSVPLKDGQTPDQFDKTLISMVSRAIEAGEGFVFANMDLFPSEIVARNAKNLEALVDASDADVDALPSL